MSQQCSDPIVGKILAGWRYDISNLAPEMCGDYESHFAGCELCRSRQGLFALETRIVHGPEFGHTMRITDQRAAA